jgi:septum site-determining protein MinC
VRGLVSASIFCRRLDAELVSIAGHYRISEDILDSERGENRLVTLSGETIHITEI